MLLLFLFLQAPGAATVGAATSATSNTFEDWTQNNQIVAKMNPQILSVIDVNQIKLLLVQVYFLN